MTPAESRAARSFRLLSFPRVQIVALALAVALALPSLPMGFYQDDYIHLGIVEGVVGDMGTSLSLYRFADGNADHVGKAIARGYFLPWWTHPELRLSFFRPIGSALFVLDHVVFGRAAAFYHLHSILWYAALVGAAGLLLRRFSDSRPFGLALLLFAIDDAHYMPVGWIASRHALVAGTVVLLALVAHIRWREDGFRPGRLLSILGCAIGLAVSEVALPALAYLFSYEVFRRDDALRKRLEALLPSALLVAAYLLVHKALGYGVYGSGIYSYPLETPLRALAGAARNAPNIFGELVLGIPTDLSWLVPQHGALLVAVGLLAFGAFVALYRRAEKRADAKTVRATRWLVIGGLLSVVPSLGGIPSSRLLLLPSLGGAVAVATILTSGREGSSRISNLGKYVLFAVHVVLAPIVFLVSVLVLVNLSRESSRIVTEVEREAALSQATAVVVLAASDPLASLYPPTMMALEPTRRRAPWRALSAAPFEHELVRTGQDSITLTVKNGALLRSGFERLFRSDDPPFRAGDEVPLGDCRIRVLSAMDGKPTSIAVTFEQPVGELRFVTWQRGALRNVALPPIGGSVTLPWEPGPIGL